MINVKRYQFHRSMTGCFSPVSLIERKVLFGNREVIVSNNLKIDQFFSQSHNKRGGYVSTNPLIADNPDSIGHFGFVDDVRGFDSKTPASDIHSTVVSKYCQSLSQVQQLKKLRPVESSFLEDELVPETAPAPAAE